MPSVQAQLSFMATDLKGKCDAAYQLRPEESDSTVTWWSFISSAPADHTEVGQIENSQLQLPKLDTEPIGAYSVLREQVPMTIAMTYLIGQITRLSNIPLPEFPAPQSDDMTHQWHEASMLLTSLLLNGAARKYRDWHPCTQMCITSSAESLTARSCHVRSPVSGLSIGTLKTVSESSLTGRLIVECLQMCGYSMPTMPLYVLYSDAMCALLLDRQRFTTQRLLCSATIFGSCTAR